MMTSARLLLTLFALVAGSSLATSALAAETEGGRTVHHSADFGWTANQDVTEQFTKLLTDGTLKAGDELVLDHKYRITGSHELPENITISAVKGGGFDVTDTKEHDPPLFTLDNGNTLNNLTINYLNTPPLGGRSIRHGIDFCEKQAIVARGKHDLLIKNCRLEGMIAIHIRLDNCQRVQLIGCRILGGFWAVTPDVDDFVVRRCLFEKSCGDGMKVSVRRALVEDCIFQDNGRDGIDSTGGINDSVIRNTIFRRMGVCGMDIKSYYGAPEDLRPRNVNIYVENCQFYDQPNAIVFTTEDYGLVRRGPENALLTAGNIKTYAPHDIDVVDCLVGHSETPLKASSQGGYGVDHPTDEGEYMRMFLMKDGYAVHYRDIRFAGDRIRPIYVRSIGGTTHLSVEAAQALDHGITGNVLDEPGPPIKPGATEAPFACGPQILEEEQ